MKTRIVIARWVLAATVAAGLPCQAQPQDRSAREPGRHEVEKLVGALLRGSAPADPQRPAKVEALKAQLAVMKANTEESRAMLVRQRALVQAKPALAAFLVRQKQFEAEFDQRALAFERAASAWQADPSDARLGEVDATLRQYPAADARAGGLPASLPWGAPKTNLRLPAETKAAWYRILTRDERVQLAQAGNLTTIGGIRFTTLPEPGQAPQDADLAETPDAQLTPAIRAKALELGKSPVAIHNWVRNNVQFTPTWGAMQGADGTLRSLRGNAIDTSSLTIALLRASGIPARYQFGTVDVPAAVTMNWLGGLTRPEAALELLQQGGIAARGISEGGLIKTIRMEHAWAIAYVNWTPSRGSRDGGHALAPPQHANPNAPLNAWVPLDAAFKQHRIMPGIKAADVSPFSAAAVLDAARAGAACTAASARQVNQAALSAHYALFKAQAQQQLAALGTDARVREVLGSVAIDGGEAPMLAGTLAVPTVVADTAVPALTPALRWRLQLALQQGTQQILALDKNLAELEGQLLSLAFVPETEADAQALAALLRPEAGGDAATGLPQRIAAYLVRVKAQLRLGDQVVAEGGSFALGQPLVLRSLVQNPEGNAGGSEAIVTVGETHVWAVQGQAQGAGASAAVAQRLVSLKAQLAAASLPFGFDQARQLLYGVASGYQASLDAKARLYQRLAGAVDFSLPRVARASSRVEIEESYGLILNVRAAGVGLHIDRVASATASLGAVTAPGYSRQSLERASAEAHHLLNRLFGPLGSGAQSALSGLASAAAQGQTIWRADSASLSEVLAGIDADSTVRGQVEQAAANGMQALVATSAVDQGGLPMDPLVVLDAQTGTAAYSVASRNAHVVQLTAQRAGLVGWLGLADAAASKELVNGPLDAAVAQLNTAQLLLGDIDSQRWQAFPGQGDVMDGIYVSRLGEAATANACDWLISTLGSQLGAGLPASTRVNHAPIILSQAVTSAQADQVYSYAVAASDADGDALAYSLAGAPTGMAIDNAGLIQWPRAVAGQFDITVKVSDGVAIAEQRYTLSVSAASAGLNLGVALSPTIANAGQTVTLLVSASSTAGQVTRSATLDGQPLALDAQGMVAFAAPASGAHPIVVTAGDGKSTASREVILTVKNVADTTAPIAEITSPAADAGLRGLVTISGTAMDPHFAYWRLMLRRSGDSDSSWQEIARGLSPVANGAMAQLDTSRYANDLYQIGLFVADVNGAQTSASVTVELVGNLKLGQFRVSFADVRAEAQGLPLMLTRTYDSTKRDVHGDFGWGWSASSQDVSVRKNMKLGLGWEVTQQQFQLCLRPVGKRRISISLPDGGLYRFDAGNAIECAFGAVPEVDVRFTPLPGPTGGHGGRVSAGAQLKAIVTTGVLAQGGMLMDDTGQPWNPTDFELTTEEGFKYLLREGSGVLSVTDPFGNKVTYGAGGYIHSTNLAVTLTRDSLGRISRATDPNGKSLAYAYNSQGELESVTDRDGNVTRFAYATVAGVNAAANSGNVDQKHLLSSITDPRGAVVMGNQFDRYGRLTGTADALGQAAMQEFDTANNKQVVIDRRGNRTVYSFDADGNITTLVNALGQTTTFTFDANGNETSVTNALGETTERTFDSVTGKQLSEKNALGHTTKTAYPTVGTSWQRLNPLSTTDARGSITGYTYGEFNANLTQPGATPSQIAEPLGRTTDLTLDLKGQLRALDIAGEQTIYQYDSQGRKTQEANGMGHRTTYAYDTNGNETGRTVYKSINGQTATFTTTRKYDAENRLIEETDALGGTRTTTYNAAGKVATQTDAKGQVTAHSYDANARLVKTQYPDATSETTGYDSEGNETARTDRSGRTTRMEYDALNRRVRTIYPDGSSESTEYDAAGRVTGAVDRNGKRSAMEYDAAGRVLASVDATGRRTSQTYDENGSRKSVTIDGRTTHYEYDALNRLTKTTWPDGSTHTSVYRPDNRKQSETDQRGVVTNYGYDAAGRLTSVSQSLGAVATATTTYRYDETGAKTAQVDALGRTTAWTFDGGGRVTSRQIQDGTTETSQYDIEGNRLTKKTFGGETLTFQYDSQNRLVGQVVPQGAGANSAIAPAAIIFSYSASGLLLSQQEQGATSLGGTQSYTYDANDRLTGVKNPLGQINYSLDANGNVIERSISNAGTVKNEYDAANRLVKVTAPDGKQAFHTYDAAGRVSIVERELNPKDGQPQALVTYHRYDSANRTTAVAEVKRVGSVETLVAGQALTRVAGGTIAKIETHRVGSSYDSTTGQFTGTPERTQDFEYDGNARLTRETRTQGGATTDTAYEYDAVGNRTRKTVTTAAGVEVTTYTYDVADRLTQETVSFAAGGSRVTTYTWDGNGNLASKTEPAKATLYRFDPQNRLIDIRTGATTSEAQAAAPSVSYAYDASGNRVKKGGATPSSYLIDSSHSYAQVALESKGGASITYVRGLQLIRQTTLSGVTVGDLFPLSGHLGTSLGALDSDGRRVEQMDVDSFGNIDQSESLEQAHLYTGEHWDQESQFLYLRARWYDPRIGRFISADPFNGRQRDPRSLNRYAYTYGDPHHRTDPSGKITAGELGVGLLVVGALAVAPFPSLQNRLSIDGVSVSVPPLAWKDLNEGLPIAGAMLPMLAAMYASQEIISVATGQPALRETDAHHTVPKYMCGHPDQEPLAIVSRAGHWQLHPAMTSFAFAIDDELDAYFRRTPQYLSYRNIPPLGLLAKTRAGRERIRKLLDEFYEEGGWYAKEPAISPAFSIAAPDFIAGNIKPACEPKIN